MDGLLVQDFLCYVREIKDRFADWDGRKSDFSEIIAEEFGVSVSCINGIIYEQNWQHVI